MNDINFSNFFIMDSTSPSGIRWKVDVYTGKDYKCLKVKSGDTAGCLSSVGYYLVRLNKKLYRVHRVIYEMVNGEIPSGVVIDHIDGDPSNNCIDNLRATTQKVNAKNSRKKSSNTSGFTGVYRQTMKSGYDYMVAQAECGGDVKTKAFSVLEYGLDEATRLAREYRTNLIKLFNLEGAQFSGRHGF